MKRHRLLGSIHQPALAFARVPVPALDRIILLACGCQEPHPTRWPGVICQYFHSQRYE